MRVIKVIGVGGGGGNAVEHIRFVNVLKALISSRSILMLKHYVKQQLDKLSKSVMPLRKA